MRVGGNGETHERFRVDSLNQSALLPGFVGGLCRFFWRCLMRICSHLHLAVFDASFSFSVEGSSRKAAASFERLGAGSWHIRSGAWCLSQLDLVLQLLQLLLLLLLPCCSGCICSNIHMYQPDGFAIPDDQFKRCADVQRRGGIYFEGTSLN